MKLKVSLDRFETFLSSEDQQSDYLVEIEEFGGTSEPKFAYRIQNGFFRWRPKEDRELSNQAKRGLLVNQERKDKGYRRRTDEYLGGFDNKRAEEQLIGLLTERVDTQVLKEDPEIGDVSRRSFNLKNINLEIFQGEKVAVIGRSSSGVSSLLYALIGEMIPLNKTKVHKYGSVSFLGQSSWLMSCSIKENIIMGKEYNAELFSASLEVADLRKDVKRLTNGIDTEVSDAGENLSGGQKARIALARCFYQRY